jgi:hypothetical protein
MKLVREHINEKFHDSEDPINDMGIGILGNMENTIKGIIREDSKNHFIYGATGGNIHYIEITGAVGRNQQAKTGNYFVIHFYSDTLYSQTERYNNGEPKKINRKNYAIDLINNAGISECFYDVFTDYKISWKVRFKIKEEYKKYFKPNIISAK